MTKDHKTVSDRVAELQQQAKANGRKGYYRVDRYITTDLNFQVNRAWQAGTLDPSLAALLLQPLPDGIHNIGISYNYQRDSGVPHHPDFVSVTEEKFQRPTGMAISAEDAMKGAIYAMQGTGPGMKVTIQRIFAGRDSYADERDVPQEKKTRKLEIEDIKQKGYYPWDIRVYRDGSAEAVFKPDENPVFTLTPSNDLSAAIRPEHFAILLSAGGETPPESWSREQKDFYTKVRDLAQKCIQEYEKIPKEYRLGGAQIDRGLLPTAITSPLDLEVKHVLAAMEGRNPEKELRDWKNETAQKVTEYRTSLDNAPAARDLLALLASKEARTLFPDAVGHKEAPIPRPPGLSRDEADKAVDAAGAAAKAKVAQNINYEAKWYDGVRKSIEAQIKREEKGR